MKHHYRNGWNKKKILTIPTVGKDTDQLGLSDIAGGVQNATAILEKNLAGSYKVKHTRTINIWRPNLLIIYPKQWKLMFTQRSVCDCL